MPDTRTCLRCLARTWLVGAVMSARGMQHLGQLYVMNPGLAALYPEPEALLKARVRYMEHIYTHPHWTPLFTGIMLALEKEVAGGRLAPELIPALRNATASTLSALGDSLFSGTLLVAWVFSTILLLWDGYEIPALIWTGFLFSALTAFRLFSFFLGARRGIAALLRIKRLNCINWGERLKLVNGVLLALLIRRMWPGGTPEAAILVAVLCLFIAGFLVGRLHLSRFLLCASALWLLSFLGELPYLNQLWMQP